jgi:3-phosphoshikimate 1-carboxyvinyltransferase
MRGQGPGHVVIEGGATLSGTLRAPPSKSYFHRALICSALAGDRSRISRAPRCDDGLATMSVLRGLGIEIDSDGDDTVVHGARPEEPSDVLDCGESASTLRLCLPVAASQNLFAAFSGRGSLLRRPIGPVIEALRSLGVGVWSRSGYLPVAIKSEGFATDLVRADGSFGSQHISGLLLSSPLSPHGIRVDVGGEPSSKPYLDLTVHVMEHYGVMVEREGYRSFRVPPGQRYESRDFAVPGDYSSASFIMAAALCTNSTISLIDLPSGDLPDSQILDLVSEMGAEVRCESGRVTLSGRRLRGMDMDCRDIPDLVPPLAVMGCYAQGSTRLRHVSRLSTKESSRAEALASELGKMGGKLEVRGDDLLVEGVRWLRGSMVNSWGDHRVEMALAAAALGASGETTIDDAMTVSKSYAGFYEDLRSLGADIRARQ